MIKWIKDNVFTFRNVITVESVEVSQWMPMCTLESSWDEFLIRNEKGWVRTCVCLANRKGNLKLYDHNEREIKGFNATEWMRINKPLSGKDYAISLARYYKLENSDLM